MPFAPNTANVNHDPIGPACTLAQQLYPGAACDAGNSRYSVAFMNSDTQAYDPNPNLIDLDIGFCRKYALKASVKIGDHITPVPDFESNQYLGVKVSKQLSQIHVKS